MALQLKLGLSQDSGCKGIRLFELTGAYNATTNPTGYGAPNPEVGDISPAILTITTPGGVDFALDITANFSAVFPTPDSTVPLAIANTDIGLNSDDSLPYGVYTFTYRVFDAVTGALVASSVTYFLLDCTLYCCLDSLFSKIDTCDPCCQGCADKGQNLRVRMAYIYLAAARSAVNCSKFAKAKKLLDAVNDICSQSKCQCL